MNYVNRFWRLYITNEDEFFYANRKLALCLSNEYIKTKRDNTKEKLKSELPKIYSKDLLEVLFIHPYTKIDMLVDNLELHRDTASKHLKAMEKIGILNSVQIKNTRFS